MSKTFTEPTTETLMFMARNMESLNEQDLAVLIHKAENCGMAARDLNQFFKALVREDKFNKNLWDALLDHENIAVVQQVMRELKQAVRRTEGLNLEEKQEREDVLQHAVENVKSGLYDAYLSWLVDTPEEVWHAAMERTVKLGKTLNFIGLCGHERRPFDLDLLAWWGEWWGKTGGNLYLKGKLKEEGAHSLVDWGFIGDPQTWKAASKRLFDKADKAELTQWVKFYGRGGETLRLFFHSDVFPEWQKQVTDAVDAAAHAAEAEILEDIKASRAKSEREKAGKDKQSAKPKRFQLTKPEKQLLHKKLAEAKREVWAKHPQWAETLDALDEQNLMYASDHGLNAKTGLWLLGYDYSAKSQPDLEGWRKGLQLVATKGPGAIGSQTWSDVGVLGKQTGRGTRYHQMLQEALGYTILVVDEDTEKNVDALTTRYPTLASKLLGKKSIMLDAVLCYKNPELFDRLPAERRQTTLETLCELWLNEPEKYGLKWEPGRTRKLIEEVGGDWWENLSYEVLQELCEYNKDIQQRMVTCTIPYIYLTNGAQLLEDLKNLALAELEAVSEVLGQVQQPQTLNAKELLRLAQGSSA